MSDGSATTEPAAPPPEPDRPAGGVVAVVRAVGDVRIAVLLLVLLAVYCFPGVFSQVYAGLFHVTQKAYYSHPLLWVLCGLFCVNLLACTADRVVFRRRGGVGMVITHGSILVLAAGAAWFALGSFGGEMRLYLGQTKDSFYALTPALHVRWPGQEQFEVIPLDAINPNRSGLGREPFDVRPPGGGEGLSLVDFLPSARLRQYVMPWKAAPLDPIVGYQVAGPGISPRSGWLRSRGGERLTGYGWQLRLRWVADEAEAVALARPGPNLRMIHVSFPGTDYESLLAGTPGSVLWVERFGYTVTVEQVRSMTGPSEAGGPGTPACVLRIDTPTASLRRYVLARYPQYGEDVPIPSGPATRPATEPAGAPASAPASEPASEPAELHGLLDPRIQTEYCVADEQLLIVAGPGVSPRMIYHQQDGSVLEAPLVLGEPRVLRVLGWPLHFTLSDVIERPLVRPEAQPADADEGVSALLVRTAGGMPFALPFRAFPDEAQPLRVPVGDALAEVTFGRTPRALGFSVTLTDFHVDTYPGGHVPRDYASRLRVRAADGAEWPAAVRLNEPADVRGLSLYQSSYEGYVDLSGRMADHAEPWTASVLSVSSKPGLWLVYVAFAGLCIGVVTSFFLDPLLRRKRREKEGDSR